MPMAREGESTRGGPPLSLGGLGGFPRENFEFLALLCAFLMGFYAFGTRFQSGFGKVPLALILGCHGWIQRGDRGSGPPPL